jgi:hypothetical protein
LVDGRRCVAATTDEVRYRSRKNGYHGGATPAEIVVPVAVFASADFDQAGWVSVGLARPAWWDASPVAEIVRPEPRPLPERRPAAPLLTIAEAAAVTSEPTLVERLLASAVLKAQREQHARVALDDARLKAIVEFLLARGGRATRPAVAAQLGVATLRLSGQLVALRTLLNVDAYPVLTIDEVSQTVVLNLELLKAQFEL